MKYAYTSLREFLMVELGFTCIKTSGVHTFLAPRSLWQQNQNRSDQPLLIRINTAPGGRDVEVTILLGNVPMAKVSAEDAAAMEPWMIDHLIGFGATMLKKIQRERGCAVDLVRGLLPGKINVVEVNA